MRTSAGGAWSFPLAGSDRSGFIAQVTPGVYAPPTGAFRHGRDALISVVPVHEVDTSRRAIARARRRVGRCQLRVQDERASKSGLVSGAELGLALSVLLRVR
jgi:hypothetical protein